MTDPLPIARLILGRLQALGIDALALGLRIGYQNPAKALGRIEALCLGHITSKKSRDALSRLPDALGLSVDAVERAVSDTKAGLAERQRAAAAEWQAGFEAQEAEWRATFRPHAIIRTEHTIPTQITFCALTGGPSRYLGIDLDISQAPITFIRQALAKLPEKVRYRGHGHPSVQFFGRALGIFVNYSPDHALLCDLEGNPLEVLSKAYRCGETAVSIGGRELPRGMLIGAAD
jgi:hypothetical protein